MDNYDKLSDRVAAELLRRLASDEGYRQRFQRDPFTALHEIDGYNEPVTAATCLSKLSEMQLAPAKTLKSSQKELMELLTQSLGQSPHRLTVTPPPGPKKTK